MSYALGQAPGEIKVGPLASRDPIVAFSSVMASNLLRMSVRLPRPQRLAWIRREMNKTEPGTGDEVVSQIRSLTRRGKPRNQAVFDGLRLTIANQLAKQMEKRLSRHSIDGLGGSEGDISAVFCGIMGTATVGGSIYTAGTSNPTGSTAVGTAGAGAMSAAGCNTGALREQARIAEANARAAEAAAAGGISAGVTAGPNTAMVITAAVGGVAVLGLLGFIALKK
jgi:hypothetical protein